MIHSKKRLIMCSVVITPLLMTAAFAWLNWGGSSQDTQCSAASWTPGGTALAVDVFVIDDFGSPISDLEVGMTSDSGRTTGITDAGGHCRIQSSEVDLRSLDVDDIRVIDRSSATAFPLSLKHGLQVRVRLLNRRTR